VNPQLSVFNDFHVRGASAPEWNQRYLQMSPGAMRSALFEWSNGDVHVFRKWMSERVVQQGGVPRGQLCFAMLGSDPTGAFWAQGREFGAGDLLILRGGQEFEFQRPAGVELLSVTFDAELLFEFLDALRSPSAVMRAIDSGVSRPETAALHALRRRVCEQLSTGRASCAAVLMQNVWEVLARGVVVQHRRAASVAAARIVGECQRIASSESCEHPLRIEELCFRLRKSRRTLQNSFNQVTGTKPVVYLRNMRLNAVRRQLMTTPPAELSISSAAMDAGFDHLGHFAGNYKALFGEPPSRTVRVVASRRKR
jgi:AraC family ethanolamine operon transcriptional activator